MVFVVFVSEIAQVKSGNKEMGRAYYHLDGDTPQSEKIYVPFDLSKQVLFPHFPNNAHLLTAIIFCYCKAAGSVFTFPK